MMWLYDVLIILDLETLLGIRIRANNFLIEFSNSHHQSLNMLPLLLIYFHQNMGSSRNSYELEHLRESLVTAAPGRLFAYSEIA